MRKGFLAVAIAVMAMSSAIAEDEVLRDRVRSVYEHRKDRARTFAWQALTSSDAIAAEGSRYLMDQERVVDPSTAPIVSADLRSLLNEAWAARGRSRTERFKILRRMSGSLCWCDAIVVGVVRTDLGVTLGLRLRSGEPSIDWCLPSTEGSPAFRVDDRVRAVVLIRCPRVFGDRYLEDGGARDERWSDWSGSVGSFPFVISVLPAVPQRISPERAWTWR